MTTTDRKLLARLMLAQRMEGDRLVLADDVLGAAIDGRRALTAAERDALRASPLTLRRFKVLADERRAQWQGSAGMLRAASGGTLSQLQTDDGHWRLHFVGQDGGWRLILALDPGAPFAQRLLREQPMLRVLDGGGAILLQGRLDGDGECEAAWPFDTAPAAHLQHGGARFNVEPLRPEPAR